MYCDAFWREGFAPIISFPPATNRVERDGTNPPELMSKKKKEFYGILYRVYGKKNETFYLLSTYGIIITKFDGNIF